ncbi:hypothetical protein [Bacteroides rodentium]
MPTVVHLAFTSICFRGKAMANSSFRVAKGREMVKKHPVEWMYAKY